QLLGHRRIVTIGDSNTYGVWLTDRSQAYPSVLEELWNATPGAPPLEVINLGYPGTNSSVARNILREALVELRPDLVTVMIGTNDWWTVVVPLQVPDWRTTLWNRLWRWSRVYRLLFMIRRAHQTPAWFTDESGDRTVAHATAHLGDATLD